MCSFSQRKQQKDLLAALQKVVVPIYCTSFLAVEEEKQQKITRVTLKAHTVLKSYRFCFYIEAFITQVSIYQININMLDS